VRSSEAAERKVGDGMLCIRRKFPFYREVGEEV
jgi:hypothetical protein